MQKIRKEQMAETASGFMPIVLSSTDECNYGRLSASTTEQAEGRNAR